MGHAFEQFSLTQEFQSPHARPELYGANRRPRRAWTAGLDAGDLEDEFGRCGRVEDVYITEKGYAFVTMAELQDAKTAVSDLNGSTIDGQEVHPAMAVPFTMLANLCWNPAISIPAGITKDGLPIGLQIMTRRHADDIALRLARIAEQTFPWPRHAPG